jgi:hypothetical protein
MKLFLSADLHLGGAMRASSTSFKGDWKRALSALADTIVKSMEESDEETGWLLLAADVFDKNMATDEEIKAWVEFTSALALGGIGVGYTQGNHDASQADGCGLPGAIVPGAVDITGKTLDFGGVIVHGIPPGTHEEMLEAVRNAPPCHIMMIHAGFFHLLPIEAASPVTAEDVPAHVGAVLAGHIHITAADKLLPGGGYVYSPGALFAVRTGEMGDHIVFSCTDKTVLEPWEQLLVHTEPSMAVQITDEVDVADVMAHAADYAESWKEGEHPLTMLLHYPQEARAMVASLQGHLASNPAVRTIRKSVQDSLSEQQESVSQEDLQHTVSEGLNNKVQTVEDPRERALLGAALSDNARTDIREWVRTNVGQEIEF